MQSIGVLVSNLRPLARTRCAALSLGFALAACGASDGGASDQSGASAGTTNMGTAGRNAAGGGANSAAGTTSGAGSGTLVTAGSSGVGASGGGAGAGTSGGSTGGSSVGGTSGGNDAGGTSAGGHDVGGASNHAGVGGNAGGSGGPGGSGGAGGAIALPPHTGKWRIMPLGDSITGTTCGPQLLSKGLIDHGKTNFTFVGSNLNNQNCNGAPNVQTEGHGGYLVTDLVGNGQHASELPMWTSTDKADLVLMQFGTNDVWNNRDASQILSAYGTILSDLRTANANVILLVAQITPLNPTGCDACEARVEALNAQIPAWAASKSTPSSPVSVVDLHSVFDAASYKPSSMYTADGVHPNAAGGQLIANKWYAALTALGAP